MDIEEMNEFVLNYLVPLGLALAFSFSIGMIKREHFSSIAFLSCFSIAFTVLVWLDFFPFWSIILPIGIVLALFYSTTTESTIGEGVSNE